MPSTPTYDCHICHDTGSYRDYRNGAGGRWTKCDHEDDQS